MHYRSYLNIRCEFYPCHAPEYFVSCMFCWCPLYLLDCKGDYRIISGIKDCSHCVIPHIQGGYDYVLKVVREQVFNRPTKRFDRKRLLYKINQLRLF